MMMASILGMKEISFYATKKKRVFLSIFLSTVEASGIVSFHGCGLRPKMSLHERTVGSYQRPAICAM